MEPRFVTLHHPRTGDEVGVIVINAQCQTFGGERSWEIHHVHLFNRTVDTMACTVDDLRSLHGQLGVLFGSIEMEQEG